MIAENVQHIRRRIAAACEEVGRKADEVTLVAVSKTFGSNLMAEAFDAGVVDIGENFVQELVRKREELREKSIRWHFVGHLQTNKVKHIAPWIHLVHSVDSVHLGRELARHASKAGRTIDVLVEVNTSGEQSKFGVRPDAVEEFVKLLKLPSVRVQGLMTIGPFLPDPEASRPAFRTLRETRDLLRRKGMPTQHLSMGMTNDFEVAIQEGATIVRIGTAIFGKRTRRDDR